MPAKPKSPQSEGSDFDLDNLGSDVTAAERKKVLALAKSKDTQPEDNSAMLGGDTKGKKRSTAERLQSLFQQHNFSPVTKIIRRLKIEESKIEAYERAEMMGLEPRLLFCLPKPDKKSYYSLLLQLVRFELPELKAVEMSGQVETGMTVLVKNFSAQQKVIRVDAGAPDNIKAIFGQNTDKTLTLADKKTAIPIGGEDDI